MANEQIRNKLHELHEEIETIESDLPDREDLDDTTVEELKSLVSDLSNLVDRAHPPGGPGPPSSAEGSGAVEGESLPPAAQEPDHAYLADRIRRYQSEHPLVMRFVSQMTDLLAMLGI